jgi:cytoskeleton protein RodZ
MKRTGEILKKAREEKKLSLHEVALFLKINSRVLQAIEEGDHAQLPARTFLRGFIQSYAKFLKLDAQSVLQVFSEETAPPQVISPSALQPAEGSSEAGMDMRLDSKKTGAEEKSDLDVISLERSILTQSQVAQDKLGFKTIAVSIVGLLLVIILYFANSVVKKYQREAQVDRTDEISVADALDSSIETKDEQNTTQPTKAAGKSSQGTSESAVKSLPAAPISAPSPQNSQNNSHSAVSLPSPMIETKPKLVEKTEAKPVVQKPVTPTPVSTPPVAAIKPMEKPIEKAPEKPTVIATPPPKTAEFKNEGKLIEVIVEASDAVEIEYSSSKTNPQKMVLKADQIHTFKSRSGVRLKISNGGAVNIIMNGRDLGAPGAAGQPVQVTY